MSAQALTPMVFAVPLVVATFLAAAGRWLPRWTVDAVAATTTAAVAVISGVLLSASADHRIVLWVGGWTPRDGKSVGITLVVDQMGAGMSLLAALLVLAALVYSWRYYASVEALLHVLLLTFLAGVCGFAVSGDLFDMFVFFELMGAVAYALTGYRIEHPDTVQGAFHFGVVNSLGAYFTLTGIALLYARTGELGLAQIGTELAGDRPDALVVASFVLTVTGMLVKAAAVPFHFWTADAERVAPSPVCLLLSGVMVQVGVYGVARVYWVAFSGTLPQVDAGRALLVLGAVTALVGGLMCLLQHHLKRLLAYSTISHVGLFLLGVGTMTPDGLAGASLYVIGHAGVKGALFLGTGILLNRFGSADMHSLREVAAGRVRVTAAVFLLGAAGLAGLPPFGTFLGKSSLDDALLADGHWWALGVTLLASSLTAGAVLAAALRVFFGAGVQIHDVPREDVGGDETEETGRRTGRTPATMYLPALALLVASFASSVPALGRTVTSAAERFVDRPGTAADALRYATTPPVPGHPVPWTAHGLVLAGSAALLAVCWATLLVYGAGMSQAWSVRARRVLFAPKNGLVRIHAEHLGDSVTWLVVGTVVLAGLLLV